MRLALVHMRHRHTGGTERYLNQIAAHLAATGHEITIVCRSHEEAPHPAVRFAVVRGFSIGSAWRMWDFARAVEQHVRTQRYDVVYGLGKTWTHDVIRLGGGSHQTYLDIAQAATLRARDQVMPTYSLKDHVALRIERRALAPGAYRRVITNSMMVQRDIEARYRIPAASATVIYNGVDVDRFHPQRWSEAGAALRRACGFAERDFVALFLGTGYGRKGLQPLLESFPAVQRQRPEARLLVIGYDSARARYEGLADELGLASVVRFLGGRRDAEAAFAAANLYVLPTHYDPFANTTLEALATGLPVITTNANGGSELLTEGVTGSIIDLGSATDSHERLCAQLTERLLFWCTANRARDAQSAARALAIEYRVERALAASTLVLEEVDREKRADATRG